MGGSEKEEGYRNMRDVSKQKGGKKKVRIVSVVYIRGEAPAAPIIELQFIHILRVFLLVS
jgi:hypothetical protein